ncbi:Fic family protein [Fibrobacter sp. UWEL]|nr:Fic family protein [Fibrobacter sp. UWEL]
MNILYIYRMRQPVKYIYQYESWPNFTWDQTKIQVLLGNVRYLQGKLLGQLSAVGFSQQEDSLIRTLTENVVRSSEIEGVLLNYEQVHSSIARQLGLEFAGMVNSSRDIDGVVAMLLDATQNYQKKLDAKRLFGWHASLFPSGYSGIYKVDVGKYRKHEMQVVSGGVGRERVHYEAPLPNVLKKEMDQFLKWLNDDDNMDLTLKSAVAHFWFVVVHPFDDGNGRVARAISDYLLAKSDRSEKRFYSLSAQILAEKKEYYRVLALTQQNDADITEWLVWYLNCLMHALENSEQYVAKTLGKAEFWERIKDVEINERQRVMINKLLNGFDGKLKTSKWAKLAKCSEDTALRDIKDLVEKNILKQEDAGGRSTSYVLV